MCTLLFSETWRIACKSLRKLFLRCNCVNKLTNHWMFTCSNKVKIFTFYLIHHGIHFIKAHNTGNYITSYHIRRNTVCEPSVNHEISCIWDNCWMKSCNISHKVIKTITSNLTSCIHIDSVESFHNICMIWYFKIRNYRLTKLLNFNILAVIFSDWYTRINDVRNSHHNLINLFIKFLFWSF